MAEKVTGVNVEGRNYEFLAGQAVRGACTALATDWVKPVTLPEGTLLVDGLIVAVMFVNGTSVGWSGTKTVYSSDGENFFYDQAMTDPVTLPQPECYELTFVSGDEYTLSCFPVVVYGTHRLPVCDSRGHYAGGALWAAGDTVAALYLDEKFMLLYSVVDEVKLGVPSPASSNAVARDAVLKSEIADVVAVDNMYSVSSNAVARALSFGLPSVTQTLLPSAGAYSRNTNTKILGAYGYTLFSVPMYVPTGYHKEYILHAQITTDDSIKVRVKLNNIKTFYGGTWSVGSFRIIVCSAPFRESDIVQETTLSYGNLGTNLYVQTDGGNGYASVYNVGVTCFCVKD